MNAETAQLVKIVTAFKCASAGGEFIYQNVPRGTSPQFEFILKKGGIFGTPYFASSPVKWYDICRSLGISEIYLVTPLSIRDRNFLAFANMRRNMIITKYHSGSVFTDGMMTCWKPEFWFDGGNNSIRTVYKEIHPKNRFGKIPHYKNNTKEFENVLLKLSALSAKINEKDFEKIFAKAAEILDGKSPAENCLCDKMPEENKRLYAAADIADVFGGMCSWNDEPPHSAKEKGLSEEYDRLSDELLKQFGIAVMFAVNEW